MSVKDIKRIIWRGSAPPNLPLFLGFALLVLGSCAAAPRILVPDIPGPEGEFAALDGGGRVYLVCDVPQARPILDLVSVGGISGKEGAQVLDMTRNAAIAFYPAGESRRYLIAAKGKYPKGRINVSFSLSRGWKKTASPAGGKYWRSDQQGLSVAIDGTGALITDGDPYSRRGAVEIPPGYEKVQQGAVMAGWFVDAGTPINTALAAMELPIQIPAEQIIFALYPAPEEAGQTGPGAYRAVLRLETPSASQARALVTMISLLRAFSGAPMGPADTPEGLILGILLTNPPVQDDSSLILRSGVMESGELALLFQTFSVYFK